MDSHDYDLEHDYRLCVSEECGHLAEIDRATALILKGAPDEEAIRQWAVANGVPLDWATTTTNDAGLGGGGTT